MASCPQLIQKHQTHAAQVVGFAPRMPPLPYESGGCPTNHLLNPDYVFFPPLVDYVNNSAGFYLNRARICEWTFCLASNHLNSKGIRIVCWPMKHVYVDLSWMALATKPFQ